MFRVWNEHLTMLLGAGVTLGYTPEPSTNVQTTGSSYCDILLLFLSFHFTNTSYNSSQGLGALSFNSTSTFNAIFLLYNPSFVLTTHTPREDGPFLGVQSVSN